MKIDSLLLPREKTLHFWVSGRLKLCKTVVYAFFKVLYHPFCWQKYVDFLSHKTFEKSPSSLL